ncbi:histidine phosphatase family protein, partial [Microbacteriaceae bacterium K1510]|nr:histidine phosphatase family protein [Microbacteriaceae bacterium K1510]
LKLMGIRFDRWLQEQLGRLSMNQTIACVTHGGPLRWFRSRWMNGDEASFWQTEGVSCGKAFVAEWDGTEWRYV